MFNHNMYIQGYQQASSDITMINTITATTAMTMGKYSIPNFYALGASRQDLVMRKTLQSENRGPWRLPCLQRLPGSPQASGLS